MNKLKVGIVFGGMSTENKVSIVSASYVVQNLDKEKYDIYPIYISSKGIWGELSNNVKIEKFNIEKELEGIIEIENVYKYLKQLDIIFPVLHGLYGEDGTIQGMLELLQIPYVGCGVLASSVGMDKVYTKIVLEKADIKQTKYEYIRKYKEKYIYVDKSFNEKIMDLIDISKIICKNIKFPMFIKPSNSGSSVGVRKADNIKELIDNIKYASEFDKKILIEEGIDGREVECAVLGNEEVISSCLGEIKPAEEFYSFDAKYNNSESKVIIPAIIDKKIEENIKVLAIKAFKSIDGKGLSRVDFFIENGTNEIYINEINTLPGFTSISMYPKLFEKSGITYVELLDKLIEKGMERKRSEY